jgi:hypothetical protein
MTELTDYLGGEDVSAGLKKPAQTTMFNTGATNETSFTALSGLPFSMEISVLKVRRLVACYGARRDKRMVP